MRRRERENDREREGDRESGRDSLGVKMKEVERIDKILFHGTKKGYKNGNARV